MPSSCTGACAQHAADGIETDPRCASDTQQFLHRRFAAISPPSSRIGLLGSIWAVSLATKPLRGLSDAADRSADSMPRDRGDRPREVKQAAVAFQTACSAAAPVHLDRTRMLAAISHDLRHALTRMRLRTEMLDEATARQNAGATCRKWRTWSARRWPSPATRTPTSPADRSTRRAAGYCRRHARDMDQPPSRSPPARDHRADASTRAERRFVNIVDNAVRYAAERN